MTFGNPANDFHIRILFRCWAHSFLHEEVTIIWASIWLNCAPGGNLGLRPRQRDRAAFLPPIHGFRLQFYWHVRAAETRSCTALHLRRTEPIQPKARFETSTLGRCFRDGLAMTKRQRSSPHLLA